MSLEAQLQELMARGATQREAAMRLGVSLGKVQRTLRAAAGVKAPSDAIQPDLAAGYREEIRRLQSQVRSLTSEVALLHAADRERELAEMMSFKPMVIPHKVHAAASPGYPLTVWSDWHWGETVDKRETGGANAFNREIAQARVGNLVNNTIKLLRQYGGLKPTYPGIWVCLGGDMISGLIHEELRETNWGTIEEQADEVGDAIYGALLRMADEFKEVHVPCVVGNHGRLTHKPRAKQRAQTNREWGIYRSLQKLLSKDKRFHFYIPEAPDFAFEVYGTRFLLTHGDQLGTKGGDGIIGPIGPIRRGSYRLRGMELAFGRDLDYAIIGHWHSYQPAGQLFPVIVNDTLKGPDEYSLRMLRIPASKPAQALCLVSPKHGLGAQWRVDVSE